MLVTKTWETSNIFRATILRSGRSKIYSRVGCNFIRKETSSKFCKCFGEYFYIFGGVT